MVLIGALRHGKKEGHGVYRANPNALLLALQRGLKNISFLTACKFLISRSDT